MAFYDTKSPLKSLTVWGGVIAILPQVATIAGPIIGLTPGDTSEAMGHADEIITAVGGLLAIWGRFRARSRIGK